MGDQSKPGVASGISIDDTSGAAVTSFSGLREMSDPRVFQQGRVQRGTFDILRPNGNPQMELFLVKDLRNALQKYQSVNPSSQEIIIGGKSIQPSANGYIFNERDNAGLLNQIFI